MLNTELIEAMNQTDVAIQGFLTSMATAGTLNTTAIIITTKHGQTPLNPAVVCSLSTNETKGPITHALAIIASGHPLGRSSKPCCQLTSCLIHDRSPLQH